MKTLVLNGAEILALGFPKGKIVGTIIRIIAENYTAEQKEYVMNLLRAIIKHPHKFKNHEFCFEIIAELKGEAIIKKGDVGQIAPHINEGIIYGKPISYENS